MDLILIVALTAIFAPLVALAAPPEALRISMGLPFVLFFPGYGLISALLPRRDDPELVERLALSLILSLAMVPLIGLALNYSPWGIRLESILAFLGLFIALTATIGLLHRLRVPPDDRFRVDMAAAGRAAARNLHVAVPAAAVIALAAVLLIVALNPTPGPDRASEQFTEFYLLGPDGTAEGYPSVLAVDQEGSLTVGITNQEGEDASYRIDLLLNGTLTDRITDIRLDPQERWQRSLTFTLDEPGERQPVELLLYQAGGSQPYRTLRLWVDGFRPFAAPQAEESVLAEEEAPAPPTPPPAPTPPPEPTPPIHVVSRGEYLTLIAVTYGVKLKDVLALNPLPNPNLIFAGQEIVIPIESAQQGGQ